MSAGRWMPSGGEDSVTIEARSSEGGVWVRVTGWAETEGVFGGLGTVRIWVETPIEEDSERLLWAIRDLVAEIGDTWVERGTALGWAEPREGGDGWYLHGIEGELQVSGALDERWAVLGLMLGVIA